MNIPAETHDGGTQDRPIGELLKDFETVLTAEYEALSSRDLDRLEQLVARKNALLGELEEYARTLEDRPGEWSEIKSQLERCAQANRVNGGAIDVNRIFVADLLDILHGRLPGERTYDSRGKLDDKGTIEAFVQI